MPKRYPLELERPFGLSPFASSVGGVSRKNPPASGVGGFRREHLIVDGGGFVTGINDPIGDGTWFNPVGNLVGHVGIGINTQNAPAAYFEVSGFDGTQNIAIRFRESGAAMTSGIILAHPSNASAFLGVFQENASAANGVLTTGGIETRDDTGALLTDLGTGPTRQQVWDALAVNVSSPTFKNVVVKQAAGNATLRPMWYGSGFKAEVIIEGVVLFDNTADAPQAVEWLEDLDVYTGDPFSQQLGSMSLAAIVESPDKEQLLGSMSLAAIVESPDKEQLLGSMSLAAIITDP